MELQHFIFNTRWVCQILLFTSTHIKNQVNALMTYPQAEETTDTLAWILGGMVEKTVTNTWSISLICLFSCTRLYCGCRLCLQCVQTGNQASCFRVNPLWPLRVHVEEGAWDYKIQPRGVECEGEAVLRHGLLPDLWAGTKMRGVGGWGGEIASLKPPLETAHNQCLLWYKPLPLLASYNMLGPGTSHCPDLVEHVLSHSTHVPIPHFTLCNSLALAKQYKNPFHLADT